LISVITDVILSLCRLIGNVKSGLFLNANSHRTLKSKPGHHQTAIQTLPLTVGLSQPKVIVLDALRKQRNRADYLSDLVPGSAATGCFLGAKELLARVRTWLKAHRPRPDLL
jgi:hypothetical protein